MCVCVLGFCDSFPWIVSVFLYDICFISPHLIAHTRKRLAPLDSEGVYAIHTAIKICDGYTYSIFEELITETAVVDAIIWKEKPSREYRRLQNKYQT